MKPVRLAALVTLCLPLRAASAAEGIVIIEGVVTRVEEAENGYKFQVKSMEEVWASVNGEKIRAWVDKFTVLDVELCLTKSPKREGSGNEAIECSKLHGYLPAELFGKSATFRCLKITDDKDLLDPKRNRNLLLELIEAPPVQAMMKDERENFEASYYLGIGIDSFAAKEHKDYLDAKASGDLRERGLTGFDFEYRLRENPDTERQWWVYGETVHGVRSSDVDCNKSPDLPVCDSFSPGVGGGSGPNLAIIRNATSLEGFLGLRWEFHQLQWRSTSSARAYLKAQAGFLTVASNGGDVVDVHHVAIGLVSSAGRYHSSYLEVGYGRTDLFVKNPHRRWKVDGYLTWHPVRLRSRQMSPFAQLVVDSDAGSGADSIQTYVGYEFGLDQWAGKAKPEPQQSDGSK